MICNVKGVLLDKFTREVKTQSGGKEERFYLRIYQQGQRLNLDVNVKSDTYFNSELGESIELDNITITSYKDVLYARQ